MASDRDSEDLHELKIRLIDAFSGRVVETSGSPAILSPDYEALAQSDRLDIPDLIRLMTSFVEGYSHLNNNIQMAKNSFNAFINRIFRSDIIEQPVDKPACPLADTAVPSSFWKTHSRLSVTDQDLSLHSIWKRIKQGRYSRDDKIALFGVIQSFDVRYIDWDDRDQIVSMVKYALSKAMILYNGLVSEELLQKLGIEPPESASQTTRVYKIGRGGLVKSVPERGVKPAAEYQREDILRSRNRPAMTLTEFADFVLSNTKRQAGTAAALEEPEPESEPDRRKLVERDENRDNKTYGYGNTQDMG